MTGWHKVIAATLLVVVALAAFNLSVWRRLRAAARTRAAIGDMPDAGER